METSKLALKYHTEFAQISCNFSCRWLSPLGFKEEEGERAKMKVSGDLIKIKNKSLGVLGLTPLTVEGFEVLGHTVNCQSWD